MNDMAVYRFRLEQVRSKRAAAADMEAARQEKLLLGEVQNLDDEAIAARVIVAQNANGEFDAFARYESHFDRLFNRAFRSLLALQKHRASHPRRQPSGVQEPATTAATNTALQNEPPQQPRNERLYSIDELIEGGHIPSLRESNRRTPPKPPERTREKEEDAAA